MIRQLTASDFATIWETALPQPRYARASTILGAALPGKTPEQIAAYPPGRRNALLFQVRESALGARLNARSQCPSCSEWLEFSLTAREIGAHNLSTWEPAYDIEIEGVTIAYRLPDSHGLAAAAQADDPTHARMQLLQSCIIAIEPPGSTLTENAIAALAEAINEKDPLAAIELSLNCPACNHHWTAGFDILGYFWEEVVAQAKSLLVEVAALARGYGWSEKDILSMSAARRKLYLELLGV
jgi:hypothetical protein